jgi:predicted metal-dependent phosphoesterase TrpH
MKQADLHAHTVFSDGTYTPQELVEHARVCGLDAIAICDHDSVGAIPAALTVAQGNGLEVIPAIEMSAEYAAQEVHILGYFIDYTSADLRRTLETLTQNRIERVQVMVERLRQLGVGLKSQDILDFAGKAAPGRMHVAQVMVRQGFVASLGEAFARYIGDKSPAYVCGFRLSPRDAIQILRDIGGVAVLAHPYVIRNDALIPELVSYGLAGLEVYYPEHTQSMVNFYLELARRYDLAITGGSDFHGAVKPDVPLGAVKIPYTLVEALRERKP